MNTNKITMKCIGLYEPTIIDFKIGNNIQIKLELNNCSINEISDQIDKICKDYDLGTRTIYISSEIDNKISKTLTNLLGMKSIKELFNAHNIYFTVFGF